MKLGIRNVVRVVETYQYRGRSGESSRDIPVQREEW
jgi:hypothetical protein